MKKEVTILDAMKFQIPWNVYFFERSYESV